MFEICLYDLDLPTVRKFYKEQGTFCLPHFATLEEQGFEHEHFDYCYGLALLVDGHDGEAKSRLAKALSNRAFNDVKSKIYNLLAEIYATIFNPGENCGPWQTERHPV